MNKTAYKLGQKIATQNVAKTLTNLLGKDTEAYHRASGYWADKLLNIKHMTPHNSAARQSALQQAHLPSNIETNIALRKVTKKADLDQIDGVGTESDSDNGRHKDIDHNIYDPNGDNIFPSDTSVSSKNNEFPEPNPEPTNGDPSETGYLVNNVNNVNNVNKAYSLGHSKAAIDLYHTNEPVADSPMAEGDGGASPRDPDRSMRDPNKMEHPLAYSLDQDVKDTLTQDILDSNTRRHIEEPNPFDPRITTNTRINGVGYQGGITT